MVFFSTTPSSRVIYDSMGEDKISRRENLFAQGTALASSSQFGAFIGSSAARLAGGISNIANRTNTISRTASAGSTLGSGVVKALSGMETALVKQSSALGQNSSVLQSVNKGLTNMVQSLGKFAQGIGLSRGGAASITQQASTRLQNLQNSRNALVTGNNTKAITGSNISSLPNQANISNLDPKTLDKQIRAYEKLLDNRDKIFKVEKKLGDLVTKNSKEYKDQITSLNKELKKRLDLETNLTKVLGGDAGGKGISAQNVKSTEVINKRELATRQKLQKNLNIQARGLEEQKKIQARVKGLNPNDANVFKANEADFQRLSSLEKANDKITQSIQRQTQELNALNQVRARGNELALSSADDVGIAAKRLSNLDELISLEKEYINLSSSASKSTLADLDAINGKLQARIANESKLIDTQIKQNVISPEQGTTDKAINQSRQNAQQRLSESVRKKIDLDDQAENLTRNMGNRGGKLSFRGVQDDTAALGNIRKQQEELTKTIVRQQKELQGLDAVRAKSNGLILKSADDVDKLNQQLLAQTGKFENLANVLDQYSKFTNVIVGITSIGQAVSALVGGFQDLQRAVNGSGEALDLMAKQGFDVGVFAEFDKLSSGNKDAILDFATTAVAEFNNFEEQLRQVGTVFQTSLDVESRREELNRFGETIQNLVNTELKNTVTESEALAATYEALSAGFTSAADSTNVMVAGLKLSASSGADSGDVMQLLAKTMNAYGQSADEAGRTAAVLNGIVENGITTVSELSNGFGQLSTIAEASGVKLEEAGGALATLTTKGIGTNRAMTQLQSLFSTLIDPSFSEKLSKMNIDFRVDKTTLETEGLVETLKKLNDAVGGSSVKFGELFTDVQSYRAAIALTADGVSSLEKVTNSLVETTANKLDEVFSIRLDESQVTQFTQIVNQLNSTLINVGRSLAPIFQEGVDFLAKFSNQIATMVQENEGAIVGLVKFMAALKAFQAATSAVMGTVVKLTSIFLGYRVLTGKLFVDLGNLFAISADGAKKLEGVTGVFSRLGVRLNNNALLANQNITAFDKLKVVFGNLFGISPKTSQALQAMGQSADVSAAAMGKLTVATKDSVSLFPSVGNVVNTVKASFSNFAQGVASLGGKIKDGVVKSLDALPKSFSQLKEQVASIPGAFTTMATSIKTSLVATEGATTGAFTKMGLSMKAFLATSVNPVVAGLAILAVSVGAPLAIFKRFDGQLKDLRTTTKDAEADLKGLQDSFKLLENVNTPFSALSGTELREELESVKGSLEGVAQGLLESQKSALDSLDSLMGKKKELEKELSNTQNEQEQARIKAEIVKVNETIVQQQKQIEQAIQNESGALADALKIRLEIRNETLETILDAEQSYVASLKRLEEETKLLPNIFANLGNIFQPLEEGLSKFGQKLQDIGLSIGQYFGGEFGDLVQVEKSELALKKVGDGLSALYSEAIKARDGILTVDDVFLTVEDQVVSKKRTQVDLQKELNNLWMQQLGLAEKTEGSFERFNTALAQAKTVRQELLNLTQRDIDLLKSELDSVNSRLEKFSFERRIDSGTQRKLNELSSTEEQQAFLQQQIILQRRREEGDTTAVPHKKFFSQFKGDQFNRFIGLSSAEDREKFLKDNNIQVTGMGSGKVDINSLPTDGLMNASLDELKQMYVASLNDSKAFKELSNIKGDLEKQLQEQIKIKAILEKGMEDLKILENVGKFLENSIDSNDPTALENRVLAGISSSADRAVLLTEAVRAVTEKGMTQGELAAIQSTVQDDIARQQQQDENDLLQFKSDNAKRLNELNLSEDQLRRAFLSPEVANNLNLKRARRTVNEESAEARELDALGLTDEQRKVLLDEDPQEILTKPLRDAIEAVERGDISAAEALKEVQKVTRNKTALDALGVENLRPMLKIEADLIRQSRQEVLEGEQAFVDQLGKLYDAVGVETAKFNDTLLKSKETAIQASVDAENFILQELKSRGFSDESKEVIEQKRKLDEALIELDNVRIQIIRNNALKEVEIEKNKADQLNLLISTEFTRNEQRVREYEEIQLKLAESQIKAEKKILKSLIDEGKDTDLIEAQKQKILLMETEYLQQRLQMVVDQAQREYDVISKNLDNVQKEYEHYGFLRLKSEKEVQQEVIRTQMDNNAAYRKVLDLRYQLIKAHGGDVTDVVFEMMESNREAERLITELVESNLQSRLDQYVKYFARVKEEYDLIEQRINRSNELVDVTRELLELGKQNAVLPEQALNWEKRTLALRERTFQIELENKRRLVDLDQQRLDMEVELQKKEQENELIRAQAVVDIKQANLERANTPELIQRATQELELAKQAQRDITFEVNRQIELINTQKILKQELLDLERENLNLQEKASKLDFAREKGENLQARYQQTRDALESLIDLRDQYRDETGASSEAEREARERKRFERGLAQLKKEQELEKAMLDIENQRLALSVEKLKIETDITVAKNEQLILEKQLANLDLERQKRNQDNQIGNLQKEYGALANKRNRTSEDERRLQALATRINDLSQEREFTSQSMGLNNRMVGLLNRQNQQARDTARIYEANVNNQIATNSRELNIRQRSERAAYILETPGSTRVERAMANSEVEKLIKIQSDNLLGIGREITQFAREVTTSNTNVTRALEAFNPNNFRLNLENVTIEPTPILEGFKNVGNVLANQISVASGEVSSRLRELISVVQEAGKSSQMGTPQNNSSGGGSSLNNTNNTDNTTNIDINVNYGATSNIEVQSINEGMSPDQVASLVKNIVDRENSKIASNIENAIRSSV